MASAGQRHRVQNATHRLRRVTKARAVPRSRVAKARRATNVATVARSHI